MKHVLVDTNVLLDVLLRKENQASARILAAGSDGTVRLYMTPVILANTHYFLSRLNRDQAASTCDSLLDFIALVAQSGDSMRLAFRSGWTDVEDAMQYFAARRHLPRISCMVTNNVKHFKLAHGMEVLSPAEFCSKHLE